MFVMKKYMNLWLFVWVYVVSIYGDVVFYLLVEGDRYVCDGILIECVTKGEAGGGRQLVLDKEC